MYFDQINMHLFCKLTKACYNLIYFYGFNNNSKTTLKPLWIAYEYCTCLLIIIFYTLNKMSYNEVYSIVTKLFSAFVNYLIYSSF